MLSRIRQAIRDDPHGWLLAAALMFLLLVLCLFGTGCKMLPPSPQKGSVYTAKLPLAPLVSAPAAVHTTPVGQLPTLEFKQGENQETPSTQTYQRTVKAKGNEVSETLTTELGTAQHDKARDAWGSVALLATKLKAARLPQVLGFLLILAALAMFYPPIKAVTMSTTLQIATGATGVALIALAPMFATLSPAWIVVPAVGGLALYFFAWKHGHLQSTVDANKNGIPDALEKLLGRSTNSGGKQNE